MSGHHHPPDISRLKLSILITALLFLVEIVGGLLSGSLALVSDAGHMFSDLLSLLLSLVALILATGIATQERTLQGGFHSFGLSGDGTIRSLISGSSPIKYV